MGSRMTSRTVIITGGAAGIGRGIAKALAAEGANVVIADLNLEAAQSVVDEITKAGGKANRGSFMGRKYASRSFTPVNPACSCNVT